ncbi:MAG: nthB [Acidimicrobiales bacterium]|nr:nthB [Acidimicrobiales bacterium]
MRWVLRPLELDSGHVRALSLIVGRMDGIHDMGGMHGFGPVVTADGELAHHEPWELRAQILGLLSGSVSRGTIEALEPATYLGSSYYVRWLLAAEGPLVADGVLDQAELDRWRETFAADPGAVVPERSDPETAQFIRTGLGPHQHGEVTAALFSIGDRVRVRPMHELHHHRCPRYVRGVVGQVERVCGADPVPGLPAGEVAVEPTYTVRFSSVDLFGDGTPRDEPPHVLMIDLWERYLQAP